MQRSLAVGSTTTVEVSATAANLGPGFDCFGLALGWREQVQLSVIEAGYRVEVSGEGADRVPADETHLILRAALTGLRDLEVGVPGLRLRCRNTIPHGRGLGSSSAAIVAGLTAAAGLAAADAGLDRDWLLGHADAIEGHPDNVAAAVYGGFTLAYCDRGRVRAASGRVAESVGAVVLVPAAALATATARGLLPATVPHADAAANAGRAALLVHALGTDPDLLHAATEDWLHQRYRASAMPDSAALVDVLRQRGHAAVISGAGPTVLVLGRSERLRGLLEEEHPGFAARALGIGAGAAIVATEQG